LSQKKRQYEKWPFPNTNYLSKEGFIFLKYLKQWLEATDRKKKQYARIIDIGCGTGHTVLEIAKHFPEHQFLGIDNSEQSLSIARNRAKQLNVRNIRFQKENIEGSLSDLGRFDIILCLGVLHHTKNLTTILQRIVQLLREDGHIFLWFYGYYGRLKHNLNQQFLKKICSKMEESKMFLIAEEFVKHIKEGYILDSGFYSPAGSGKSGIDWLLQYPQWLADQMIPEYECPVNMEQILDMFDICNIQFDKWLGVSYDFKNYTTSGILIDAFQSLSARERLVAIDYLLKPSYYFITGTWKK